MLQIKNTLGGGKPEGLYVWKKYECIPKQTIVNPTFHIKANVSTQKAIITSDDINFKAFGTLTDSKNFYQSREPEFCNFMNGFNNSNSRVHFAISTSTYSGQLELNYSNNSYWNAFTKMTPTDTGAELTASILFKTTIDDTLQYTGTKTIAAKIGKFISYVVSDKENAYPDGAVHTDGYWYEKVVDGFDLEKVGCTKFEEGSFTNTSDSNIVSVNHSLGELPKFVICASETLNNSETYIDTYCAVIGENGYGGNGFTINNRYYTRVSSYTSGNTASVVKFSGKVDNYNSYSFKSGVTYHYIILA